MDGGVAAADDVGGRVQEREQVADLVGSALRLLRTHLRLDVAFVSQLLPEERVFRFVDADREELSGRGRLQFA